MDTWQAAGRCLQRGAALGVSGPQCTQELLFAPLGSAPSHLRGPDPAGLQLLGSPGVPRAVRAPPFRPTLGCSPRPVHAFALCLHGCALPWLCESWVCAHVRARDVCAQGHVCAYVCWHRVSASRRPLLIPGSGFVRLCESVSACEGQRLRDLVLARGVRLRTLHWALGATEGVGAGASTHAGEGRDPGHPTWGGGPRSHLPAAGPWLRLRRRSSGRRIFRWQIIFKTESGFKVEKILL